MDLPDSTTVCSVLDGFQPLQVRSTAHQSQRRSIVTIIWLVIIQMFAGATCLCGKLEVSSLHRYRSIFVGQGIDSSVSRDRVDIFT